MSEDKERRKQDLKNKLEIQWEQWGNCTVVYNKQISGTNQVFSVIVTKRIKRILERFILYDICFSKNIDLRDVIYFKNKVNAVRNKVKIEKAWIVGDKPLEVIPKDKIKQYEGVGIPIDFLPWYVELGEELE